MAPYKSQHVVSMQFIYNQNIEGNGTLLDEAWGIFRAR
jgi:hypothetical protein